MRTHGLTLTNMSRKELREEHIKLWTWLSENPNNKKDDYFDLIYPHERKPINECFCCELSEVWENIREENETQVTCENCPIWNNDGESYAYRLCCLMYSSPFKQWIAASNAEIRSKLARRIANMWPEEEEE